MHKMLSTALHAIEKYFERENQWIRKFHCSPILKTATA